MNCLVCKGEPPVESENFWLREKEKNGFIGHRVYYGSKETGLAAQRAVLESPDIKSEMQQLHINRVDRSAISIPLEHREKTTIYIIWSDAVSAYLTLNGVIAARFVHQRSGVVIEFHLCQDRDWQLLANVQNITIDSRAFTYLKDARKFLKVKSQTEQAKVTFGVLVLAVQKCEKVTDETLADGISKVTGEAVTKGAVKMWRKRNGVSLGHLRWYKSTPAKSLRR